MSELFAPPGSRWQPVSPRLRTMRQALLLLWAVLAVLATLCGFVLLDPPAWVLVAALVLILVSGLAGWAAMLRNVASWGYAERAEDLYIKHGAMFRELIVVPYGRMQFVDVTTGPLERLFGIATVRLHTASPKTNARIPGLPASEAARLRDRLTSLGEAQAAGL